MDTRTNGSFDNKKNNEDKRFEKQEKLDISRNLRRVNLEAPKSESKDPRNQAEQRENKNQEASRDIKAYRPNSNRPVAKPVSNPVAESNSVSHSQAESTPSPKKSNNTHPEKGKKERNFGDKSEPRTKSKPEEAKKFSKQKSQDEEVEQSSKSKIQTEKAKEQARVKSETKKSEEQARAKFETKKSEPETEKSEKPVEAETKSRTKAEETTKLFSSDEMRQIQEAEAKREESSKFEDVESEEELQDLESENKSENVEPEEEKRLSKFAIAMSNFGEKVGAWNKKQQENFKAWNKRRKEEAAQRQAEKELERQRLEQEQAAARAEAERLAKIAEERASKEQSEQEEWSRLLGVNEQRRISQTDYERNSSRKISSEQDFYTETETAETEKNKQAEKAKDKDIEVESDSEKLFKQYRQKQLNNWNNPQDHYVSNKASKSGNRNNEQSDNNWSKGLKNAGRNISNKFNGFRDKISKKREFESAQTSGKQGVGAKIKNGMENLFIKAQTKHLVMLGIAFIALLILIFYLIFRSPISGFKDALARRNYQEAGQAYEKYIGNSKKATAAEEELTNYITKLKDNAINGNTSFAATYSVLETMKSTQLNQGNAQAIIDKALEEVINLQEVNRYYESAVSSLESMDVKAAIKGFNRVAEAIPGYKETNKYLAQAKSNYREEVMKKVNTLQSQGKYTEADKLIDEGLELLPADPILLKSKESNKGEAESSLSKEVKEQAERFFRAGKFNELFKSIDDALKSSPNDESIKGLKDEYETKYAESIIKTADSIFNQDSKDAALEKIAEGLKTLPDNILLQRAKNRYEFNLDASDEEIEILRGNKDKDSDETKPDKDNEDDEEDKPEEDEQNASDGLSRESHVDAAGNQHNNSVVLTHNFDGDTAVVDQQKFENVNGSSTFKGEIAIGQIDAPTQIYYQVYASSNLSSPLYSGSLSASSDNAGGKYNVSFNVPSSGERYFIVNINYLSGESINVVLDLGYK